MSDDRYEPIDCGFHDQLEERATLKLPTEITYRNDREEKVVIQDVIDDVYSSEGAEYVRLKSGSIVRLDHIIQVQDADPKMR